MGLKVSYYTNLILSTGRGYNKGGAFQRKAFIVYRYHRWNLMW